MGARPDAAQWRADPHIRLAHPLQRAHGPSVAPPARTGRAQRRSPGRTFGLRPGVSAMSDDVLAIDRQAQAWTFTLNRPGKRNALRSEEHTSELQSLMRISYAVF